MRDMLFGVDPIVEDCLDENERLRAENFNLAANQCIVDGGLVGDEGGTPYCAVKDQNDRLRRQIKLLQDLKESDFATLQKLRDENKALREAVDTNDSAFIDRFMNDNLKLREEIIKLEDALDCDRAILKARTTRMNTIEAEREALWHLLLEIVRNPKLLKLPRDYSPEVDDFHRRLNTSLFSGKKHDRHR